MVVFQCGVCDESFEQAKELKQHIVVNHQRKERKLPLKYQPLTYNPNVKNRFECYICKIRMTRIADVKNHIKQHGYYNKRCEVCYKQFISSEEQRLHMCGTIEVSGPIKCEYCSGSFQAISQLLAHLDCEHDNRTMYRCQKCPKFFGMKQLVDLHEKYHPEVKPFACEQCCWRFGNQEKLNRHLLTHSNESMTKILF